MNLKLVAFVATCVWQASASKRHEASKWYPCPLFSTIDGIDNETAALTAQCGKFSAPLCYSDICTAPRSVNQTIEIFVKLIPANNPETDINIWITGRHFQIKELTAFMLYSKLNATANLYLMDPRGSRKSTILDCGVTTRDPNFEYSMDPAQVESCAIDLESKFGDLAAFSPTSAAHDLFNLISKLSNGASTFVYGSDYEALMVERLMHLAPPEVTGYILDSPVSTTGVYNYFTDLDDIVDEVARTFLERCDHDRVCSSHFKEPNTLITVFQDVLTALDNQPDSACFEIINTMKIINHNWPASHKLRKLVFSLVMTPSLYMTIPQFVYRLKRCQPHDVDVLTTYINNLSDNGLFDPDPSGQSSELLYNLIVFLEIWERPTPSLAELKKRFLNSVGGWGVYADVKLYCAFSKEQSKVCDRYSFGKYRARGINYKRDRYWNASVTIPSQASVLVMSSKMSMFPPHKYTKRLFESLIGKHKELITFETGNSPMFFSTYLQLRYISGNSCALEIIASYARSDGDLTGLDKSCLDEMPTFQMIPSDFNEVNFTNSSKYY